MSLGERRTAVIAIGNLVEMSWLDGGNRRLGKVRNYVDLTGWMVVIVVGTCLVESGERWVSLWGEMSWCTGVGPHFPSHP